MARSTIELTASYSNRQEKGNIVDTVTKEQRSLNMSRIRSKNTKPELVVRKTLTSLGIRYRLHNKKLPGKPDIVNRKKKFVIFINGCFWHQHDGCRRSSIPKSNTEYWIRKLEHNVIKQKTDVEELRKMGLRVFIIWECQTKDDETITKVVKEIINEFK